MSETIEVDNLIVRRNAARDTILVCDSSSGRAGWSNALPAGIGGVGSQSVPVTYGGGSPTPFTVVGNAQFQYSTIGSAVVVSFLIIITGITGTGTNFDEVLLEFSPTAFSGGTLVGYGNVSMHVVGTDAANFIYDATVSVVSSDSLRVSTRVDNVSVGHTVNLHGTFNGTFTPP